MSKKTRKTHQNHQKSEDENKKVKALKVTFYLLGIAKNLFDWVKDYL